MPDSNPLTADALFRRWLELLAAGNLSTAAHVAAGYPALIPAVQARIDDCLSSRAADLDATLREDPATPPAPPDIPGYTFLEHLGRGGMGTVWRVRDELDQEFALKLARADRLSAAGKVRFHAEARTMKQVEHPNIAPVYHFLWHNDTPYFLMDVYPASLKDRVPEYQADPEKAVRLMAAVAGAVGWMHGKRIVHRDLKPGNVLLTADGTPKVSDLGLAKSIGDDPSASESSLHGPTGGPAGSQRTSVGSVLGTRAYMAPEQAAGLVHLANPKWDVFALGVMLHELLTGRLPASSAAPQDLLNPDRPDNPPPSVVKPGLDPVLGRIIRKCLARAEADRYPDAAVVAAELRTWLALRSPPPAPRPRRWLVVAGLGLALAGATATIPAWWPTGPSTAQADPPPPPDPVAELQARLRADGRVEVIPERGLPAWSDLVVGKDRVKPFLAPDDGATVIDSGGMTLMDLPPPGLDRFRFDVEARQLNWSKPARFGIYAGRHPRPTTAGEVQCYLSLHFNDLRPAPGRDPHWFLAAQAHRPATTGAGATSEAPPFADKLYLPPARGDYHRLGVEVRPTGVTYYFDGRRIDSVPWALPAADEAVLAKAANFPPGGRTDFTPAGGYGLLVFGGTCAFRNGTLSVLSD